MAPHRFLWILALAAMAGCHSYPDYSEEVVDALSRRVRDPEPGALQPKLPDPASSHAANPPMARRQFDASMPSGFQNEDGTGLTRVAYQAETDGPGAGNGPNQVKDKQDVKLQPRPDRLVIPPDLPGAGAEKLVWPKTAEERERMLKKVYPELPPLPSAPKAAPGPLGRPMTLGDLQSLAAANNPTIKGAVHSLEAARGAVIAAGAYPNPSIFWESDTVGTGGAGYQGGGFDQVIKGAGKIKLAKAMAVMDLRNAELALRKAESDLATQVRTYYFATLVNRENVKVSHALAVFADNVYDLQVDILKAGQAAPYEPMQLRPLAAQARLNLLQATNQYMASWRQLAASLGLPSMPLTELAGSVDLPVPIYDFDFVVEAVQNRHTDVLTALNNVQKARYNEELARVNVYPDPDVHFLLQKDQTTPPHYMVYSASVSVPIPVWDQNRGNIIQAKNQVAAAIEAAQQTKLQLTSNLADAISRYKTAMQMVLISMDQINDQVRAYTGIRERRNQQGDVGFSDMVTAQQTLASYITNYVTALGSQWQAVVDIANLLQTDDLFQTGKTLSVTPIPHLEMWPPQPCISIAMPNRPSTPAVVPGGMSQTIVPTAAPVAPVVGQPVSTRATLGVVNQ